MKSKLIWFSGGFGIGITLISLGHASLPTQKPGTNTPATAPSGGNALTEIKGDRKVTGPDLEDDYAKLTNEESKYAESWAQQEKIRAATTRSVPTRKVQAKRIEKKKSNQ